MHLEFRNRTKIYRRSSWAELPVYARRQPARRDDQHGAIESIFSGLLHYVWSIEAQTRALRTVAVTDHTSRGVLTGCGGPGNSQYRRSGPADDSAGAGVRQIGPRIPSRWAATRSVVVINRGSGSVPRTYQDRYACSAIRCSAFGSVVTNNSFGKPSKSRLACPPSLYM